MCEVFVKAAYFTVKEALVVTTVVCVACNEVATVQRTFVYLRQHLCDT